MNTCQKVITTLAIAVLVASVPSQIGIAKATTSVTSVSREQAQIRKLQAQVKRLKAERKRLKAENRKLKIKCVDQYLSGSPMKQQGKWIVSYSEKYGIDPRLITAISTIESGRGKHCRNFNSFGLASGKLMFSSWKQSIAYAAKLLGTRSWYKGKSIDGIAKTYCPPTHKTWARNVKREMKKVY